MTPTTKQPPAIDAISAGPELDALIMTEIMGWNDTEKVKHEHGLQGGFPFWKMPEGGPIMLIEGAKAYSTDANHVREVEAEIGRRGLQEGWPNGYVEQLVRECVPHIDEDWDEHSAPRTYDDITRAEMFLVITATPEQRCRAALRAVMG